MPPMMAMPGMGGPDHKKQLIQEREALEMAVRVYYPGARVLESDFTGTDTWLHRCFR